jgi:hypothetical protein
MLQVFYLYVSYVTMAIHVCCKYMFQMFHLLQTYIASVLSGCLIYCNRMFQMFHLFRRMSQQALHVASVFISRRGIFHVFQMYVSYVSSECCMCFIWMLQK